jgi:ribosome-associated protein
VKKKLPVISTDKILEIALKSVETAINKKATNPVVLGLTGISIIADYFIILTGQSLVQNRAIADAIQMALKEENLTLRREGYEDGTWILMDYGHIVIHIFQDSTRYYYDIEGLWGDAARVSLPDIPV